MIRKIIFGAIIFVVIIVVIMMAFRTVDTGTVGLLTTFGQVQDKTLGPGMHLVNPISDNIIPMSIQIQKEQQKASAASSDLQDVASTVVVNYHIDQNSAVEIFRTIGLAFPDKIIDPKISEIVKSVSAKYKASQLITEREKVRSQIQTLLSDSLKPYNLLVDGVAITNFEFSPQFTKTIEQTVVAQQELITQQNQLAKVKVDAQQRVAIANATKTANILQAEGTANATVINANGEAQAIELVNNQIKNSPHYVDYFKIKTWNGKLPVVASNGGNIITLPQDLFNQSNSTNSTRP
ncbi:MAG TPA: prohibitin family protein [Nitrososphaeraceae archaeon]|nr:prohibitin family protein [Nitrososphaeraceae archaeon]